MFVSRKAFQYWKQGVEVHIPTENNECLFIFDFSLVSILPFWYVDFVDHSGIAQCFKCLENTTPVHVVLLMLFC